MEKKILHISKEDSIGTIQERFSSWYPHLRINFFRKKDSKSSSQTSFSPEVRMSEINNRFVDCDYDVGESTSVAGFEKTFRDQFGIPVQVCRRSGNLWLKTKLTDHFTLKEQNDLGEEISRAPDARPSFAQIPYGCQ